MPIYSPKNNTVNFYIYAYINPLTCKPYYIGKGKANRAWDNNHSVKLPIDKKYIIILESGLTEIGAWALERRYIKWWGRTNCNSGPLLNVMPGGPNVEQTSEMITKQLETKKSNGFKPMSNPDTIARWKESRHRNKKSRTPEMAIKEKQTKLEKYGTLNFHNEDTSKKMIKTKLEKYGTLNFRTENTSKRCLETKRQNGTLLAGSTPEAKAKRKATLLAKWGTVNTREIGKLKRLQKYSPLGWSLK